MKRFLVVNVCTICAHGDAAFCQNYFDLLFKLKRQQSQQVPKCFENVQKCCATGSGGGSLALSFCVYATAVATAAAVAVADNNSVCGAVDATRCDRNYDRTSNYPTDVRTFDLINIQKLLGLVSLARMQPVPIPRHKPSRYRTRCHCSFAMIARCLPTALGGNVQCTAIGCVRPFVCFHYQLTFDLHLTTARWVLKVKVIDQG